MKKHILMENQLKHVVGGNKGSGGGDGVEPPKLNSNVFHNLRGTKGSGGGGGVEPPQ